MKKLALSIFALGLLANKAHALFIVCNEGQVRFQTEITAALCEGSNKEITISGRSYCLDFAGKQPASGITYQGCGEFVNSNGAITFKVTEAIDAKYESFQK